MKAFLTTAELAEMLAVSEKAIRLWTDQGLMPGVVRIGKRCLRYRKATIEKKLASGQLLIERDRHGCRIRTDEEQWGRRFPWEKQQ